jgi:hypothetical protein
MPKRNEVLIEARRWLGTPLRHQHALLGFGVDCWGLVRAVGEACNVLTISDEAWAPYQGYGPQPSPRMVKRGAEEFLAPLEGEPRVGDIACLAWREGLPMHFAIRGEFNGRPTLIHVLGDRNARQTVSRAPAATVKEHGFTQEWPTLVDSWWSYPGLVGED